MYIHIYIYLYCMYTYIYYNNNPQAITTTRVWPLCNCGLRWSSRHSHAAGYNQTPRPRGSHRVPWDSTMTTRGWRASYLTYVPKKKNGHRTWSNSAYLSKVLGSLLDFSWLFHSFDAHIPRPVLHCRMERNDLCTTLFQQMHLTVEWNGNGHVTKCEFQK